MTRTERIVLTSGAIGVLLIMATYGATRIRAGMTEPGAGIDLNLGSSLLPWVGWLLVYPAWVGGAAKRGGGHTWGIGKNHLHAIKGKAVALGLFVLALAVAMGAVR